MDLTCEMDVDLKANRSPLQCNINYSEETNHNKHHDIQEKCEFRLKNEFLAKFKVDHKSSLSKGWTNYFKNRLKQINPDCNISFQYNKCLKGVGEDKRIWVAVAHCTKPGCAKYKFSISKDDVVQGSEITVHAERIGAMVNEQLPMSIPTNLEDVNTTKQKRFLAYNKTNKVDDSSYVLELPSDFFCFYKKDKTQRRLSKGWTTELKRHFAEVNPDCDLSFHDNICLQARVDTRIWHASAYCKKSECAKYNFSTSSDYVEGTTIKVHIERIETIRHKSDQSLENDGTCRQADLITEENGYFALQVPQKFWKDYKKENS